MSWNKEQEFYLKNLGEQSMAYTWMQEQTAMFYSKLNRYLGFLIIILSGVVGTNNFLDTELTSRQILFGIIGYLVTILGMLNQFLKPMEVAQQRINIGNKFQDIYYDIKQQLAKSPDNRKDPDEYLESMTQRFIEVYDFAPTINGFIIQKFKSTFKDSNITMPLNANFIDEIKIFNETQDISIEMEPLEEEQPTKEKKKRKHQPNEFQEFILGRLNSNGNGLTRHV